MCLKTANEHYYFIFDTDGSHLFSLLFISSVKNMHPK